MSLSKIRCNMINYRKGFIDITPNIHRGCINIEAWDVHPDIDISNLDLMDEKFPDNGVTSNTELEMSIQSAEDLIKALQRAIYKVKANNLDDRD